jgi:hypothetical protein
MATKPVPTKRAAQPQKYFTYNPTDPRSHLKIKEGQHAAFAKDLGWYAAGGAAKAVKPTVKVVSKATTPQGSFSTIETPAQIEARVKRMADESFTRSQTALNDQADRLRKDAEGRRLALQDAYAQAAKLNAGFGADVQSGWEQAAHTITGLAGTAVGGVQDALKADLATQEQALSRVGAGGTGFDATSQGQTEYFRGGGIPGEYDTRMGGIGRQWMDEAAKALADRGLQEGIINENTDRAKIRGDLADQISTLTTNRTKEESDLRTQLLSARGDQIKAIQDQQQFDATMAIKKVQIEQAQQKIDNQFKVALQSATTAADRAEVYRWKAQQDAILSQARNGIAQQNADAHMISANASATRAANAADAAKKGGTPATKRLAITNANKFGNQSAIDAINKIALATPNFSPPQGEDPKTWNQSAKYASAHREATRRARLNFGTIMYRVMNSITPYLREIGYTPAQIKKTAYNLTSAKVAPTREWLQTNPGFGPKDLSTVAPVG